MNDRRYYLETFGCQMNVLDSQLVEGQLQARGMRRTEAWRDADVILFNTCSVRQHAEDKVLSRLGELKHFKRRRPEVIVGVIGCMAEREKEGLFAKAPHVDLLCGPGELSRLPTLLAEVGERHERVAALAGSLSRRTEVLQRALEADSLEALDLSRAPAKGESVLQSYIRVQRGCDKFCTYCVVPFTRGAERSRPAEHIIAEARMLAERGCREVTLLGQTVNSYASLDGGRPVRFAQLLERVHEVEGIDRIRFVTSFPADWDEDIFRVMRDYPRVMPYLHIPAQSGSDAVLRRMRRGYTAGSYLRLMERARRYVPDVALAGDFIVGFCGESDEDFRRSIELVRAVQYSTLFVFKYSPRPGTAADRNLADDVSSEVKVARNNELLAVQAEIGAQQRARLVGETVEVLVEGFSRRQRQQRGETLSTQRTRQLSAASFGRRRRAEGRATIVDDGRTRSAEPIEPIQESEQDRGSEVSREKSAQLVGRSRHDMIVVFEGDESLIGSIVRVHVQRSTALTLLGSVVGVVSPARLGALPPPPPPASSSVGRPLPVILAG